jgi:hypothetical protein
VSLVTTRYSLFWLDKNISLIYKNQQRPRLYKTIQTPPTQQDGIMLPERTHFSMPTKSFPLIGCLPKQKKNHYKPSKEQSGCETRPTNQAWLQTQYLFCEEPNIMEYLSYVCLCKLLSTVWLRPYSSPQSSYIRLHSIC